jgi:hypothetical protein
VAPPQVGAIGQPGLTGSRIVRLGSMQQTKIPYRDALKNVIESGTRRWRGEGAGAGCRWRTGRPRSQRVKYLPSPRQEFAQIECSLAACNAQELPRDSCRCFRYHYYTRRLQAEHRRQSIRNIVVVQWITNLHNSVAEPALRKLSRALHEDL